MVSAVTVACPRCGAAVPADARFCPSCGLALGEAPREERRFVTVLFGDLSGFVELSEVRDAEEVKAIVDRAFARCAEIIRVFGGRVDKVIGDEIMAVFGAPVAHEDDPERAVRAALAIQRELERFSVDLERERGIPLRMHVGVNTGEVVAGLVGGSDSYTVLGDTVNTARRIEDVAEAGQILVGEPTYEATKAAIAYRRIGQVNAKGKRLPIAVWEALEELGLPGERLARGAPLTGRDEELALLESLAGMARRDHRPFVVTVVGEAGMGKSRLAAEFARRASAQGARVLHGRALPYGTASPAFAVEEIVRAALALETGAAPDETRARVRARLDELGLASESERIAALLGAGGTAPARDSAAARPGTTQTTVSPAPLLEAARLVLDAIAGREGLLVLALHELHWADDAVLDFVSSIPAARAPILAVCLTRPELLDRRPGWGTGVGTALVSLEPLPRDRAAELLDVLAPDLSPPMREGILDRAGGNPFYIEELARLLGSSPAAPREGFAVPGTVQAIVTARLDVLPLETKRVLQDAAVVGETFWVGALERLEKVEGIAREDLRSALDALVTGGFIEGSAASELAGETGYAFRQAIVREVAYASVPKQVRAEQHEIVGAWLEEMMGAGGAAREPIDAAAYHFERAAVLAREVGTSAPDAETKARTYLERAGDQALALDAASTAAGFFERALAFASEEPARLPLRVKLAEALVGIWHHAQARAHLEEALADAARLGDRALEGKALRLLADSYRMTGEFAESRGPLLRALDIAKEVGDEREEAAALRSHGLLDLQQGRWSASTLWFRQSLARFRELGDARGEAWSLQNLGWANMLMARFDEAIESLTESEAIFRELGDEEGAGWCLGMRAWVLLLRGDVMEAGRIAEDLERHMTESHPEYIANVGFVLELQRVLRAYVEVLRGRLAEAEAVARRSFERGHWAGAGWAQALGRYPLFMAAVLERRFEAARAELDQALPAAEGFGDPFYITVTRFGSALLAFEEGRLEDAEHGLEELLAAGELGKIAEGASTVRWLQASLLRAHGRLDEARSLLERGTGRSTVGLITPARAKVLLSEILLEQGDHAAAIAAAESAIEEADEEVLSRAAGLRALSAAHLAAGDAERAERAIRDELALLEQTDWEVERIRAHVALARVLDARRRFDESSETLDRAREAIHALPPDADTAPLEALLRT